MDFFTCLVFIKSFNRWMDSMFMSRLEEFSLTWKSSQNTSTLTHISKGAKVCSILGPCQGIYSFSWVARKGCGYQFIKKKNKRLWEELRNRQRLLHMCLCCFWFLDLDKNWFGNCYIETKNILKDFPAFEMMLNKLQNQLDTARIIY